MSSNNKVVLTPFNTTEYGYTQFSDRIEAGKLLIKPLQKYIDKDSLIVSIPRGGVCVGSVLAKKFNIPIDTIVSRKLCIPGDEKKVFGAVAPGDIVVIDDTITRFFGISEETIEMVIQKEIKEMKHKVLEYDSIPDFKKPQGKTIILVDDEVVTGMSMHAAIVSIKIAFKPKKLIIAVPVGSRDVMVHLGKMVDDVVCIDQPLQSIVLQEWYSYYPQLTDSDVKKYIHGIK